MPFFSLCRHLQNNKLTGLLDVIEDLPLTDLYVRAVFACSFFSGNCLFVYWPWKLLGDRNIENNLFSGPIPAKLLSIPSFKWVLHLLVLLLPELTAVSLFHLELWKRFCFCCLIFAFSQELYRHKNQTLLEFVYMVTSEEYSELCGPHSIYSGTSGKYL